MAPYSSIYWSIRNELEVHLTVFIIGCICGYLLCRKMRHDIKEVLFERHIQEEIQKAEVEQQIQDADDIDRDGESWKGR